MGPVHQFLIFWWTYIFSHIYLGQMVWENMGGGVGVGRGEMIHLVIFPRTNEETLAVTM